MVIFLVEGWLIVGIVTLEDYRRQSTLTTSCNRMQQICREFAEKGSTAALVKTAAPLPTLL
ncbi:MAG TPA: hypothetical protein DCS87_04740 [Rheinheimera sp.]|nr:hypothetical protein [Rheinheimera sp.]